MIIDNDPSLLAKEEQDFFNQVPTEKEKTKMTKDSIMALYGTTPATNSTSILGQFNGTISGGVGGGVAFNQFSNSITGGYTTNPHQQVHTSPNLGGISYGAQISPLTNQTFACGGPVQPTANLFGGQMIGATYQQQSQLLAQQQQQQVPQQHQLQFATFPPMGSIGNSNGIVNTIPPGQSSFQIQQTYAHQPAAAIAPTNGSLNQQFANLNVWQ